MEVKINPAAVALALSTYYPKWYKGNLLSVKHTDKVRGDLSLEFLKQAIKLGYKVVVVDAKSNNSFRRQLSSLTGINLLKKKVSMQRSPSRRLAFKVASNLPGVEVIVYSDPEKVSFVEAIVKVAKPIIEDKADIVVPKRKISLFQKTYPEYQYNSETEANKLYNSLLRTNGILPKVAQDLDLFFGPKAFRNDQKIVSLFLRKFSLPISKKLSKDLYFDPEDFSNIIFFPIVLALKKKLRVESVEVNFSYPKVQKMNEESGLREFFIEKRRIQRLSVLVELNVLLQFLKKA